MHEGEGHRAAPRDAEVFDKGDEKDKAEVKIDKDQDTPRGADVLERGDKKGQGQRQERRGKKAQAPKPRIAHGKKRLSSDAFESACSEATTRIPSLHP